MILNISVKLDLNYVRFFSIYNINDPFVHLFTGFL